MQRPDIICHFQQTVLSCGVLNPTYLWAQRVVVVDAWFCIGIDSSVLELEKCLNGDVHEGKRGDRDAVGRCDICGTCAEPRCNGGIDPVRLTNGEGAGVLLLEVVSVVVS
jgi:hypothetical protein